MLFGLGVIQVLLTTPGGIVADLARLGRLHQTKISCPRRTGRGGGRMIDIAGLTVRFGGVTPLDNVTLDLERRHERADRSERRRQDHVLQRVERIRPPAGEPSPRSATTCWRWPPSGARAGACGARSRPNRRSPTCRCTRTCCSSTSSRAAPATSRANDVVDAVEFVGLGQQDPRPVGTLGAAERRLVEVARAVVGKPRLVLLDEPAAGLPDDETAVLGEIIRQIPERTGAMVVLVDHDMELVGATCGHVAVLDFGRVIANGPTKRCCRPARDARLPRHGGGAGMSGDLRSPGSTSRAASGLCCTVSIMIPAGEITTLLGPNGAGKSTLVLTIGGMLRPTGGAIHIGDTELTGAKPEKVRGAGVAVVPEGRRLLPSLTVADNLRVATYNLPTDDAEAGVDYALELFPELKRRFDTTARSLSGGEQQMVVLAQALASRPKVMVVDELSLGLAPVVVKRLMPVIEQVAESGTGVLLIEQFAHVALGAGDHRLRHRGWRDPVLGHRRRAARQPRPAAVGVPARLQTRADDAVTRRQGRRGHRCRIRHRSRPGASLRRRRDAGRDGRHRAPHARTRGGSARRRGHRRVEGDRRHVDRGRRRGARPGDARAFRRCAPRVQQRRGRQPRAQGRRPAAARLRMGDRRQPVGGHQRHPRLPPPPAGAGRGPHRQHGVGVGHVPPSSDGPVQRHQGRGVGVERDAQVRARRRRIERRGVGAVPELGAHQHHHRRAQSPRAAALRADAGAGRGDGGVQVEATPAATRRGDRCRRGRRPGPRRRAREPFLRDHPPRQRRQHPRPLRPHRVNGENPVKPISEACVSS